MNNNYNSNENKNHSLMHNIKETLEKYFYHYYSIDMEEDRVAPSVTVVKNDPNEFFVRIKGAVKNDKGINISINNDFLLVKSEGRFGNARHSTHQRLEGNFERVIPLPGNVDLKKAEEFFDKGCLCVKIPKAHSTHGETLKIH